MMEMILGGDSYEKSCWKWSGRHSVTQLSGLGHHSGDPRGDPRGDFRGGIGDSYD